MFCESLRTLVRQTNAKLRQREVIDMEHFHEVETDIEEVKKAIDYVNERTRYIDQELRAYERRTERAIATARSKTNTDEYDPAQPDQAGANAPQEKPVPLVNLPGNQTSAHSEQVSYSATENSAKEEVDGARGMTLYQPPAALHEVENRNEDGERPISSSKLHRQAVDHEMQGERQMLEEEQFKGIKTYRDYVRYNAEKKWLEEEKSMLKEGLLRIEALKRSSTHQRWARYVSNSNTRQNIP